MAQWCQLWHVCGMVLAGIFDIPFDMPRLPRFCLPVARTIERIRAGRSCPFFANCRPWFMHTNVRSVTQLFVPDSISYANRYTLKRASPSRLTAS